MQGKHKNAKIAEKTQNARFQDGQDCRFYQDCHFCQVCNKWVFTGDATNAKDVEKVMRTRKPEMH